MKILAWVHLYPPDHCAGAELMLHEILIKLKERGHDPRVLIDDSSATNWEGIPIETHKTADPNRALEEADLLITHLDRTRAVIRANGGRKPIVHLIHNDRQLKYHRVRPQDADLVVANSEWIRKAIRWSGPTITVPPPVDPTRYETTPGDAITLINLNEQKGARTFWQLARILDDRPFIGVIGGYAAQQIPDRIPDNVTIIKHTPEIRKVYGQTRLLLMPSAYESWGRVGIEAAASGIPTIAHPTPGLRESLGGSGTFADRDDIAAWVEAIRELDDAATYKAKSAAARARSAELEPTKHIDALEQAMIEAIERRK